MKAENLVQAAHTLAQGKGRADGIVSRQTLAVLEAVQALCAGYEEKLDALQEECERLAERHDTLFNCTSELERDLDAAKRNCENERYSLQCDLERKIDAVERSAR